MLNNRSLTYVVCIGFTMGLVSSCYQKKGANNTRAIIENEEDSLSDTLVQPFDPNTVAYVDTFKLVPTKTIFTHIQKNAKRKINYVLPKLAPVDSLEKHQVIEQLAVTNVYTNIGHLTKNKILLSNAKKRNEISFAKIIGDSIPVPLKETVDSLNNWTNTTIVEMNSQEEWAYFEAIQWLENLYLSVENPANIVNKTKFEQLVELQLENGTEMMGRLSAYQDYRPIAVFSSYLTNILDCKYFTFDAVQLRELVGDIRQDLYITSELLKK